MERYIDTIEWCKNIKYIYLEDCRNANVARNAGARASLGKYIAFLDADDIWNKDHLESKVNTLKQKNGKAVYSGFIIDRGNKRTIEKRSYDVCLSENCFKFLWGKNSGYAQTSSFVVDRSVFGEVNWNESLNRNQDHDFFIQVYKKIGWVFDNNITHRVVWPQGVHRNYHFQSMLSFYEEHKDEMCNESACGFLFLRMLESSFNDKYYYKRFQGEFKRRGANIDCHKKLFSLNQICSRIGWVIQQKIR